jgi:murein DD-endopeptidase MepM/ murein hydrolase activator NlpD
MKLVYQLGLFAFAIVLLSAKKEPNHSTPSISPIQKTELTKEASGFGFRMHPTLHVEKMHTGLDFVAPYNTPVLATGDGKITKIMHQETGYGNQITITHSKNIKTTYSHLNKINVELGQKVIRAEAIGTVGNSGASVSPHVHYEVIVKDQKVDPATYIHN